MHYSKQEIAATMDFIILLPIIRKICTVFSFIATGVIVLSGGCAEEIVKPAIDKNIASPSDIAASSGGNYFFVLNANFSYTYDSGSILVVDKDGQKVAHYPTPRLGRSLTVSGNDLLVTYDQQSTSEEGYGLVDLYQIEETDGNPPILHLKKRFTLPNCSPVNAVAQPGFPYFAVSCMAGKLMVGELKADRKESVLSVVREYGEFTRRALFLDAKRGLLFAFVTDFGKPNLFDTKYTDQHTWDIETGAYIENQPDDAPDELVKTDRARRLVRETGSVFQYVVYDFLAEAKERDSNGFFPYKNWKKNAAILKQELRWIYFHLTNFDGTPDDPAGFTEGDSIKYYRTNFWQASPDPENPDVFYLSHRGLGYLGKSEHANSVIKVSIVGDPRPQNDGRIPLTKDTFAFERVFGFKGSVQIPQHTYLGAFALTYLGGHKIMLVNSFHDLVNFDKQRYALMATSLDDIYAWNVNMESTSLSNSYFQLAIASGGRALVSSFYDNSVILLNLELGQKISVLKKIN